MKRFPVPILALMLWAAGCASEGGVTGTGISAIVAGSVVIEDTTVDGVEVSIDGIAEVVDGAGGNFELVGEFEGQVALVFRDAATRSTIGSLSVEVPPGSATVLEEVVIDRAADQPVRPSVVRQGAVLGAIVRVECGPRAGRVTTRLASGEDFSFVLPVEAKIRALDGRALVCDDLRRGDRIQASGVLLDDGTSVALSVLLTERPVETLDRFEVEFGGSVNRVDCERNRVQVLVLTEGDPILANVQGRVDTELVCVDDVPRRCECEDLSRRDIVQVRGIVSADQPDAVRAASVLAIPGPAVVELQVEALGVRCGRGFIEAEAFFEETSHVMIVRLNDSTSVLCGERPCSCQELRVGDSLRIVGSPIVDSGRPFIDVGLVVGPER